MLYNKQFLFNLLVFSCFSFFFHPNTYASNNKILKSRPQNIYRQEEMFLFKDCPKYKINRDISINKKDDITAMSRNKNITYGMPIHCIKNRNSAVKFFMSHRAIGISFSINK